MMKINKIVLHHTDGSLHYVDAPEDVLAVLRLLPNKLKWKHTSNIETLRNKYFLMLTELHKNTNSGNSKDALHEGIKPLLFGKFNDFSQYFINGHNTGSTRNLTYEGWLATIEQLKIVANDIFSYTFK